MHSSNQTPRRCRVCLVRRKRTDGCSQLCSQRRRKGTLQVFCPVTGSGTHSYMTEGVSRCWGCFEQLVKRKSQKGTHLPTPWAAWSGNAGTRTHR